MKSKMKLVTTMPEEKSESLRRLFYGMPMAEQLTAFILLRGGTASDFHFFLADSEFADLFATALYEMVRRTVHVKFLGYHFPDADKEDLVQDLLLRLLKAAFKFQPSRGIPFAKYAAKYLRRLGDLIEKFIKQRERVVIESEIESDDEAESSDEKFSLFEVYWCDPDPERVTVANDLKRKLLNQFSPRQKRSREIARQLFYDPFDTSVANRVLINRTRRSLRENLSKLENSLIVNQMRRSSETNRRRCKR